MDYPLSDLVLVTQSKVFISVEITIVVWWLRPGIICLYAATLSEKSARHRDASMCIVLSLTFLKRDKVTNIYIYIQV